MTLTFNLRRAIVTTRRHEEILIKSHTQNSVETGGRTDGQTDTTDRININTNVNAVNKYRDAFSLTLAAVHFYDWTMTIITTDAILATVANIFAVWRKYRTQCQPGLPMQAGRYFTSKL